MQINYSKLRKCTSRIGEVEVSESLMSIIDFPDPVQDTEGKEGEEIKKVWKVKNLTFDELQKAQDKASLIRFLLDQKELPEKTNSPIGDATLEFIKILKENHGKMSTETIRKMELFEMGSVEPKVSHKEVVKIADFFAMDFKNIVSKIVDLTQSGGLTPGE